MFVVIANIQVKPESIEAFREACVENSRGSIQEPGCLQFDVLQQQDDPTKFALFEIYRGPDDFAAHKETSHYAAWAEKAAAMQAGSRSSAKFHKVFPVNAAL
ncbi:putative quinol monooxygenase [Paludisphaera mucosa]|uniref:Antibiotic biosynthesis monooxygenase n=1 Tax=Paludisphaera mucosa TaxID=3030827 RepID=A0ABT6F7B6_9BACT|nr:antibiotic biosynthesis monooxygenase [Paludisphaera mucosa]MDG3003419.1 antibiotic biosynthesis monooxygenase [Paludisphaera mucosa]